MGGPSAGVLFAKSIVPNWQKIIDDVIRSIGSVEPDGRINISTTLALGGAYLGSGRPFFIASDVDEERAAEELLADGGALGTKYETDFGVRPDTKIGIDALVNGSEDHRILAEIVLALARRLKGIIDMGGLIVPHSTYQGALLLEGSYERLCWLDVKLGVESFTDAMPGIAIALPYRVDGKREWASHTVDVAFLQAWLKHPEFHMIKSA